MKNNPVSKTFLWDLSLLLVALVWGFGFVVTKNALSVITPLYFLALRFMIAGSAMFIIFFRQIRRASKRDIINGCIVGIFLSLGFITQTMGADFTTPAKSSFLTGLNVVLVPFVAIISTRKFPGRRAVLTALVAFIGMSLLSLNESLSIGKGDLLTIFCAVFYACHIVSVGHFARDTDTLVLASVQVIFAGVCCTILAFLLEPRPAAIGTGLWGGILYSAFLSTLAAFLIQNLAQKNTPSSHAALILCLESVFGAISSALFWHEVMTLKMIMGCLLIFAAIIVNEVDFRSLFRKENTANKAESTDEAV